MRRIDRLCLICCGLALGACGAAPPRPATASASPEAEPATESSPTRPPPVTEGSIARAELDRVIGRGIGYFLQELSTEPHLEGGRFVGFRVRELRGERFRGVDLRPGDTLVRVNGSPIERPEQALQVWNGLRVASELTIEYLRDGEPHRLRFAIEDR